MMTSRAERQASLPAKANVEKRQQQTAKNELDFTKMIKRFDLGSQDFLKVPLKAMKDEEKI